jgi:transcriptional regulator with XRE-family HTH domain
MMLKDNFINWYNMSDPIIVKQIGIQLKKMRLRKNITQEKLAATSGLNRATISQLENGRAATLLTLVQVLRALEKLDLLNLFSDEPDISPLEAAKLKRSIRMRASTKKTSNQNREEPGW